MEFRKITFEDRERIDRARVSMAYRRLAMANVLCEDISYVRMNGINCTYFELAR